MGIFSKKGVFPGLTIATGIVGFMMQCWLFSAVDNRGLLPRYHIAGIVSFLLLALTLAFCWLGARNAKALCTDTPFSAPTSAAGLGLAAAGFAFSAFAVTGVGFLRTVTPLCGILAAAALGCLAYCRFKGLRANCLLPCVITVYLILRTMGSCSIWNSEPQFQQYFFPLLACIFLLMTSYYRAAVDLAVSPFKRWLFCSQAALFCCCLCCRGSDWLFYLSGALWLTFDFPTVPAKADICDE